MGAKGCLLEKVTGGFLKNHLWKFLKPQVTFLKTTGGFILLEPRSYQRKAGIEPSLLGEATNFKPSFNCGYGNDQDGSPSEDWCGAALFFGS